LQKSVIEFAKVVINEDGKIAMVAADDLGSLNRPLHRTRIDSGEWLLAQDAANLLSLGQSGTVKVEVRCSLAAPLSIPVGFAVAQEKDFHDERLREVGVP